MKSSIDAAGLTIYGAIEDASPQENRLLQEAVEVASVELSALKIDERLVIETKNSVYELTVIGIEEDEKQSFPVFKVKILSNPENKFNDRESYLAACQQGRPTTFFIKERGRLSENTLLTSAVSGILYSRLKPAASIANQTRESLPFIDVSSEAAAQ